MFLILRCSFSCRHPFYLSMPSISFIGLHPLRHITRSATTAEKLRGRGRGLGSNTGARALPKARLGYGRGKGSPPPAVRVRGITPGEFVKTQMLNSAFWLLLAILLAVKFLPFETYGQEVGGVGGCWPPNLKVGVINLRLLRLCL